MFRAKMKKVKTNVVLAFMTFSALILIACGTSDTYGTDVATADNEVDVFDEDLSAIGDPVSGYQVRLDPENLYDPPEGIQTITLPQKKENGSIARETYMRFAKGSGTHLREKGDVLITNSTTGFFFLGMAERSQGGVQDMGVLSGSIDTIEPPESGYILGSKVAAIEGHTYVVKGRDDEPGHFIIVRVTGFGEQPSSTPGEMSPTITIDYLYK